jgi:hypothetical protein
MHIKLKALGAVAGNKLITSLPLPPEFVNITIPGASRFQVSNLGAWPMRALANPAVTAGFTGTESVKAWNLPSRRALIMAEFPGTLPEYVDVELEPAINMENTATALPDTMARIVTDQETYHKRDDAIYHYVRREESLRLHTDNNEYALRLGMELPSGERRYQQWCTIIPACHGQLWSSFTFGGHIYAGLEDRPMTMDEAKNVDNLDFTRERTVAARAFIRIEYDGRIEVDAHFANIQGYGSGDMCFGLPFIEVTLISGDEPQLRTEITPERVTSTAGTWRWSPLTTNKIFLGHTYDGIGAANGEYKEKSVKNSEQGLVNGAGCSFNLEICPTGSFCPARYLADSGTYASFSLFGIQSPVTMHNRFPLADELSKLCREVFLRNVSKDGICRGGIYRYLDQHPNGRYEFSMDGNEAAFLWRGAYLCGDPELYQLAWDASRFIGDVALDHYYFNIHYHGDNTDWKVFSLIYLRFAGMLYNYLESGDPWYLEMSRAVADRWITVNRQNQPRRNMGRDTEPVEGILMLYDLTGDDHYFQAAWEIASDVRRSLDENHYWRSGFGVGPFWGANALVGTAWNGTHLFAGISEFVLRATPETCPDYDELLKCACGQARRIIQSIDEDYQGFHRTSGAFLRRMALIAQVGNDRELASEIARVMDGIKLNYAQTGEKFFDVGHHCAGYIEGRFILNSLDILR